MGTTCSPVLQWAEIIGSIRNHPPTLKVGPHWEGKREFLCQMSLSGQKFVFMIHWEHTWRYKVNYRYCVPIGYWSPGLGGTAFVNPGPLAGSPDARLLVGPSQMSSESCAEPTSLSGALGFEESRASPRGSLNELGHSSALVRAQTLESNRHLAQPPHYLCNLEQVSSPLQPPLPPLLLTD